VLSDGSAVYTPGISENRSGTSAFYHPDAIGSTRDITNSSQTVTDTRRFDAFGMPTETSGSNPTPFGFVAAGQYQSDTDSGLMLLGHRYYDSSIGRFISRDPAYAGDNWYAYCDNDPLRKADPSGLFGIVGLLPLLGAPGLGEVIGVIIVVVVVVVAIGTIAEGIDRSRAFPSSPPISARPRLGSPPIAIAEPVPVPYSPTKTSGPPGPPDRTNPRNPPKTRVPSKPMPPNWRKPQHGGPPVELPEPTRDEVEQFIIAMGRVLGGAG
jgi:RHS repeat-associated protein